MIKNESNIDRLIRVIVGIVLLVLVAFTSGAVQVILAVLGAILLATGIIGFCPLYKLFKIDTSEKKGNSKK